MYSQYSIMTANLERCTPLFYHDCKFVKDVLPYSIMTANLERCTPIFYPCTANSWKDHTPIYVFYHDCKFGKIVLPYSISANLERCTPMFYHDSEFGKMKLPYSNHDCKLRKMYCHTSIMTAKWKRCTPIFYHDCELWKNNHTTKSWMQRGQERSKEENANNEQEKICRRESGRKKIREYERNAKMERNGKKTFWGTVQPRLSGHIGTSTYPDKWFGRIWEICLNTASSVGLNTYYNVFTHCFCMCNKFSFI